MYDKITKDMTQAMKEQNKFNLSVLRMLKSALQLEKINKKSDLNDDDVISVIKKQVKMRTDSISEFQKFNRTDEIANLEKEIALLKTYLPEELSEDEIDKKIEEAFNKVNPTSMKDMGMIMKELQSISSRADMSVVSNKVKTKIMEL
jgi:hypothetical protein